MDVVSELISSIVLQHSAIGTMQFSHPWSVDFLGAPEVVSFTLVSGEPCWLLRDDMPPVSLQLGDTVFVTVGCRFVFASAPEIKPVSVGEIWRSLALPPFTRDTQPAAPLRIVWGGGGQESLILGLAFGIGGPVPHPLLAALPDIIVFSAADRVLFPWMSHAIAFLAAEDANRLPGFAATARVLSELIFVSYIRAYALRAVTTRAGWLRGLLDPKLARSLAAIHRDPARQWTVATLAECAAMSRTSFAQRFAELIGQTPIEYLTSWRMQLACNLLLKGRCHVAKLAATLGYESEAAFRKTFKRHVGVSPAAYCASRSEHAAQSAAASYQEK